MLKKIMKKTEKDKNFGPSQNSLHYVSYRNLLFASTEEYDITKL